MNEIATQLETISNYCWLNAYLTAIILIRLLTHK